jgi:hypothetical protein
MTKLILISIVFCAIFGVSVVRFAKDKTFGPLLQLLGAGFLVVVVFTHIAEIFHLFPSMGWGLPNSPGHYIDLISAIAGFALLLTGYFSRRLKRRISN